MAGLAEEIVKDWSLRGTTIGRLLRQSKTCPKIYFGIRIPDDKCEPWMEFTTSSPTSITQVNAPV